MKKYFIFFIAIFFTFSLIVSAEDTDTCTYALKNSLAEEAKNVTAAYDFATDSNGNTYFVISVYNLTKNIFIRYKDENELDNFVIYDKTDNGTYTFEDYNLDDIFKYSFEIWIDPNTGCSGKIKSVSLVKPKRNKFADYAQCQYEKMKDYYYCKEWLTNNFYVTDENEILEKINNKLFETSTTSKIIIEDSEPDYITFKEIYISMRIYLIIGFAVGIIIDLWCIKTSIRKVRESTL